MADVSRIFLFQGFGSPGGSRLELLPMERELGETGVTFLQRGLRNLDSGNSGPFSGLVVTPSSYEERGLREDIQGLANQNLMTATEDGHDFEGPLSEPLQIDQVNIDILGDGRRVGVWFLTPHAANPFVDEAVFPGDSEHRRLTANRFIAVFPEDRRGDGPDLDLFERLRDVLLKPWWDLQVRITELAIRGTDPEGMQSSFEGTQTLEEAVSNLRNPGSRNEGDSLQFVYAHGRKLAQREVLIEPYVAFVERSVREGKLLPQEVIDGSESMWIEVCARPAKNLLRRLENARAALGELTTQATQVFTYLNVTQSEQTRSVITVVGAIVFMLGILGLYLDSLQSRGELVALDGDGPSFTVLAISVIAGYSIALALIYQFVNPRGEFLRRLFLSLTGLFVVGGVTATAFGVPAVGLIGLPLAGLTGAALIRNE